MFSAGWEEHFLRQLADECIEEANAKETEQTPHTSNNVMTAQETLVTLRVSVRILYRYTEARNLNIVLNLHPSHFHHF